MGLFRPVGDARKNSKRLLCGLFYGQIKADLGFNISNTKKKGRGRGDVKKIQIEGKEDKGQEVTVRPETALQKKAGSV